MKRKFLSITLAVCMIISMLPITALAGDYGSHWAAPYIEQAHERGWMVGDGNGNFRPDASITRGEFAVMLWRALGSPAPQGECPFTDIPADAYYRDAVTALYETGIVTGYGGGLFGPNDTLTREMAFVMLARAFDLTPEDANAYAAFIDGADTSDWARDETSALTERGYVEGSDGLLLPKKALTRGEMAKLLIEVYDREIEPGDDTVPVITLTQSPTTSTYGNVTVTVTATDDGGVAYIGWRSSSSGASYTDKTGFTDITATGKFSVSSNGWYAVSAVDMTGNFSFKLIQITNILTSSGGGGGGTSYTVTYDANGGSGGSYAVTGVPGSHTMLDNTVTGFTASGKAFVGWNTAANGKGTFYATGATLQITANTTLYAMWSGDGGSNGPLYIYNEEALAAIGTDSGVYTGWTLNADYLMVADISLTAVWTPIGDDTNPFEGSLDGNGHTIDGLTMSGDVEYAGLFGAIDGGSVSELTLANVDINIDSQAADICVGGIVGYNEVGTVKDCVLSGGSVAAKGTSVYVGGIAGYNEGGEISDSGSECDVIATATTNATAGGVVGETGDNNPNTTTITKCYATGNVTANVTGGTCYAYAGGIAGNNYMTAITKCYAAGDVKADAQSQSGTAAWSQAGGIAGYNVGSINNSRSAGDVNASASGNGSTAYAGGIIGNGSGTGLYQSVIANSYATGDVTATSTSSTAYAGGIAGLSYRTDITYSYATCGVSSSSTDGDAYAGGLVGFLGNINNDNITDCTNCAALNGSVEATSTTSTSNAGRVTGAKYGTLTNNYADSGMSLTGMAMGGNTDDAADIGGMGVSAANYNNEAWWGNGTGFWESVWGNSDVAPWVWGGNDLPILYWQ